MDVSEKVLAVMIGAALGVAIGLGAGSHYGKKRLRDGMVRACVVEIISAKGPDVRLKASAYCEVMITEVFNQARTSEFPIGGYEPRRLDKWRKQ